MSVTIPIAWEGGGEGALVAIGLDKISVTSSKAFPPGARVYGALTAPDQPRIRLKVHACKKDAAGLFHIEGRPLDLSRALLDQLTQLLTA